MIAHGMKIFPIHVGLFYDSVYGYSQASGLLWCLGVWIFVKIFYGIKTYEKKSLFHTGRVS